MPDVARWRSTWVGLGVARPDEQLFAEVMRCYAEPHRSYHTTLHLDECFAKLDEARQHADRGADNEERSAAWAQAAVLAAGLDTTVDVRVRDLILATRHVVSPPAGDAALLVDIDLAILGSPADRFDEYERQVRQEYSWVPGFLFKRKRREILEGFLRRPALYNTEHFRSRYEAAARANLSRSIHQLES